MNTAYDNGCLPASLMTKRESIASIILANLCACESTWNNTDMPTLAKVAVQQADALLAVLAGPEAA